MSADVTARFGEALRGPITWGELVQRTEDPEWDWDYCIVCGNPDVATCGVVLEDGPAGALRRVAWCSHPACESDRALTDYLLMPRASALRGGEGR